MRLPVTPRLRRDNGRSVRLALLLALLVVCGLVTLPSPASAAPACGVLAPGAAPEAVRAVQQTCKQIGVPYSWGGGHAATPGPTYGQCDPSNGAPNDCHVNGFDCSGLVRYGYYLAVGADILGPGTAESQYNSSAVKQRLTNPSQFLPGDLLYYSNNGASSGIHHVAMYLGGGYIVEAADSGTLVRVGTLSSHSDFYSATRLYLPHHGATTLGVFRGHGDTFFLTNSNINPTTDGQPVFGADGDIPISGDWDGDGYTTIGVYRPSTQTFYLSNSNINPRVDAQFTFGINGDIPITGDWNGDGYTTVGVFRPSTATFYLTNSNITPTTDGQFQFGEPGDLPVAGDWNGDGYTTVGVRRPSNNTFYLTNSNINPTTDGTFVFGADGDLPVSGDWDADGFTTIGVYRPTTSVFYLSNSNISPTTDGTVAFGAPGDRPVTGDWDGR